MTQQCESQAGKHFSLRFNTSHCIWGSVLRFTHEINSATIPFVVNLQAYQGDSSIVAPPIINIPSATLVILITRWDSVTLITLGLFYLYCKALRWTGTCAQPSYSLQMIAASRETRFSISDCKFSGLAFLRIGWASAPVILLLALCLSHMLVLQHFEALRSQLTLRSHQPKRMRAMTAISLNAWH